MSSGSVKMSIESNPISFVYAIPQLVPRPACAQAELISPSCMVVSLRVDDSKAEQTFLSAFLGEDH